MIFGKHICSVFKLESHVDCFKLMIQISFLLLVSLYFFLKKSSDKLEITITFIILIAPFEKALFGLQLV